MPQVYLWNYGWDAGVRWYPQSTFPVKKTFSNIPQSVGMGPRDNHCRGGSRNSLRGGGVLGQNSSKGGGGGLGSRSVGIFIYWQAKKKKKKNSEGGVKPPNPHSPLWIRYCHYIYVGLCRSAEWKAVPQDVKEKLDLTIQVDGEFW